MVMSISLSYMLLVIHAPGDDLMGYKCESVGGLSWFSVSLCGLS